VASTGNLPAIDAAMSAAVTVYRKPASRAWLQRHGATQRRTATARQTAVTLPSPMPGSATPYPAARATAERRPHRSRPRRHRPVVRPEVGDQRNRYGRPMTPQAVISVMRCHAGRAALLTPAVTVTRVSAGCCWWWACQDLNLGPHPYQVSRAKRCADRRFPRSPPSVRGEGMRSRDRPHKRCRQARLR
jgi:hypothetical protein